MLVNNLKIGDKVLIMNKHNHIKLFLMKAIKNSYCSMHGEYMGKEYHLQKMRPDGGLGMTHIYQEGSEIEAEIFNGEKHPGCQCSGCNQQKKTIKQEDENEK